MVFFFLKESIFQPCLSPVSKPPFQKAALVRAQVGSSQIVNTVG